MAVRRTYGIDVSFWQGDIDWQAVSETGLDFVILRAGFGVGDIDTQFVNNITGAIAAGIENIGVYWFSYAHDADTARAEVRYCLSVIEPYAANINLPVWFDWEGASYTYVSDTYGINLTATQIQEIGRAWCNAVSAAGYQAGIYSNKSNGESWFKISDGVYLWDELNCDFWYARYGANDETALFINPAFESIALSEHPETDFFQYSDVGRMQGINSTRVDLNIRYETVEEPEPEPEPEPERYEKPYRTKIEYVEIRGNDLELTGIIDTAESIIWHSTYYGTGDFEIYVTANQSAVDLLQIGNYVTRLDNEEIGIIESLNVSYNLQNGRMITASGRFIKSVLDRRHIYQLSGNSNTPTILRGNVETNIRNLVLNHAIQCADSRRNIAELELGALSHISVVIRDDNGYATQKQVSYRNLLEYTEEVLQEYKMASRVIFDEIRLKFQYIVYMGADRSAENADGNEPVIFSPDFDNLSEIAYTDDTTPLKNCALIGGAGEDVNRFYSLLSPDLSGLALRETWVDASSIERTYTENETEQTYTDEIYTEMINAQGKQELAALIESKDFSGTIDITNGNYIYRRDFWLGDLVSAQYNLLGIFTTGRITEITEVQDENGYAISAVFSTEEV